MVIIVGQRKTFLGVRILWFLMFLLIAVVLAGGPGVHLGLWSPLKGFLITMTGSFLGGAALAVLSIIVIIIIGMNKKRGGMGKAILTLLVSIILVSPVAYLRLSGGGGYPVIHDITTDMVTPPEFIELVGKRGDDANSLEYDAEEVGALQAEFYPYIKPLMVADNSQKAFAKALDVASNLGWKITGVNANLRRFEATEQSFWFNFSDDVVVTVKPVESGSRIDMRSVSRVGMSDFGVNAKRIMAFQKAFNE